MPTIVALDETSDPTAKLLGERLRHLRSAAKLTQDKLAKMTSITSAYISLIERGKANPTLDMMVKLADAVGVRVWDLVRPMEDSGSN